MPRYRTVAACGRVVPAALLFVAGCACAPAPMADGGSALDARGDTPAEVDADLDAPLDVLDCPAIGAECGAGACGELECNEAARVSIETVTVSGARGRWLTVTAAPGGYCAPTCEPWRLNDTCAPCAVCSGEALAGSSRIPLDGAGIGRADGFCREPCTPSATSTGCARAGYACDPETRTCMEACTNDVQCQIVPVRGPDGTTTYLDRGPDHPAFCDGDTGRCRTVGTPGAAIGDPCEDDADCADGDTCAIELGDATGVCTRLGCLGLGCPTGTACDVRHAGPDRSGCFRTCEVGVEDGTPAMLGPGGGSPACGPGLACAWNGVAEPGESPSGSCVPGEYNAVTVSNVGTPCTSDAECFSPFGLGTCLWRGVPGLATGVCSVTSCGTFLDGGAMVEGLLPGVRIASPVCDPSRREICLNLADRTEPPRTACIELCDLAADCAPGYACVELGGPSRHACWPSCTSDLDCMPDACLGPSGARCDLSVDEACTCGPLGP